MSFLGLKAMNENLKKHLELVFSISNRTAIIRMIYARCSLKVYTKKVPHYSLGPAACHVFAAYYERSVWQYISNHGYSSPKLSEEEKLWKAYVRKIISADAIIFRACWDGRFKLEEIESHIKDIPFVSFFDSLAYEKASGGQ